MEKIERIFSHFATKGSVEEIHPTGNGHINSTYVVTTSERKYILQKINNNVFHDVFALMNNIVRVTEHLQEHDVFTLRYKPTYDGKLYYEDDTGYYRVYKYIDNTICFDGLDGNLSIIYKAGFAFGNLHCILSTLDPNDIVDVIPNFHNLKKRYRSLCKTISCDNFNRVEEVKDLISYIKNNVQNLYVLDNSLEDGSINRRIIHNDPKINNVLFDKNTLDVRAIIDLDTVMTGTVLFDFGDALRSLFTGQYEDSKDLSKIKVDLNVYRAYLDGYYRAMNKTLNKKEISLFGISIAVMAMELAIRFLDDYLAGDIYFSTEYEKHNLIRAKTQIKLTQDILASLDDLNKITEEICK